MHYAYLFEARGIQRFLFASGKLRDMLGGSELVDYICAPDGYLKQVLGSLELDPQIPRQAGGVFYLVFSSLDEAKRMQATWRLASAQWLPGLERVDAISEGVSVKTAIENGLKKLHQERNRVMADLPRPGPLSERSPRTGLAAVSLDKGESLDAATKAMRDFRRPAGSPSLSQRFLDTRLLNQKNIHWPNNFESDARREDRFPLGSRRLVGLLHADGNGLGELLRILNEACADANDNTYIKLYKCFSDGITQATLDAAAEATKEKLLPYAVNGVMPARPLVLGGDDLSVVIRADLALPFAEAFLTAFEIHSQKAMSVLRTAFEEAGLKESAKKLPDCLTACAGITFMKCSQPFQSAYELAEGLCKRAKNASRITAAKTGKIMPSSIAFLKVQDSLLDDVDELFEQTLCARHGDTRWELGLNAYSIKPVLGLPLLGDIYRFRDIFYGEEATTRLNDRPLRELATLVHTNTHEARQAYNRWRQVSGRETASLLSSFDKVLASLFSDLHSYEECHYI